MTISRPTRPFLLSYLLLSLDNIVEAGAELCLEIHVEGKCYNEKVLSKVIRSKLDLEVSILTLHVHNVDYVHVHSLVRIQKFKNFVAELSPDEPYTPSPFE